MTCWISASDNGLPDGGMRPVIRQPSALNAMINTLISGMPGSTRYRPAQSIWAPIITRPVYADILSVNVNSPAPWHAAHFGKKMLLKIAVNVGEPDPAAAPAVPAAPPAPVAAAPPA